MWPFKKNKIFKITWKFCAYPGILPLTEYVKAPDIAIAWKRIRKQNKPSDITLINWEVFDQ